MWCSLSAKYPVLTVADYGAGQSKDRTFIRTSSYLSVARVKNGRRFNSDLNFRSLCCKCQLVDIAPATSAAYGFLLLSGGIFAFTKSRSKGSLFGGFTGAALMATAYFLMQGQETKAIGDAVGFGSAFLFSSVFGIRLAATQKLTPAGPLLGLSLCVMVVFISSYFQDSL